MWLAHALVLLAKFWGACGAIVAVLFLLFGIDRVDATARGAHAFRPLLLPGLMLLWPVVLRRWFVRTRNR